MELYEHLYKAILGGALISINSSSIYNNCCCFYAMPDLQIYLDAINNKKSNGQSFYSDLLALEQLVENEDTDSFHRIQILAGIVEDLVWYMDEQSAKRISIRAANQAVQILKTELLHPSDRQLVERILIMMELTQLNLENNNIFLIKQLQNLVQGRVERMADAELCISHSHIYLRAVKININMVMRFCLNQIVEMVAGTKEYEELILLSLDLLKNTESIIEFTTTFIESKLVFSQQVLDKLHRLTDESSGTLYYYFSVLKYIVSDAVAPPYTFIDCSFDLLYFLFLSLLKLNAYQKIQAVLGLVKRERWKRHSQLIEAMIYILMPSQEYKLILNEEPTANIEMECASTIIKSMLCEIINYNFRNQNYNKVVFIFERYSIEVEKNTELKNMIVESYLKNGMKEIAWIMIKNDKNIKNRILAEYWVENGKYKEILALLEREINAERSLEILQIIENKKLVGLLIKGLRVCIKKYGNINSTICAFMIHYVWECIGKPKMYEIKINKDARTKHTSSFIYIIELIMLIRIEDTPPFYKMQLIQTVIACLNSDPFADIDSKGLNLIIDNLYEYNLYCIENEKDEQIDELRKCMAEQLKIKDGTINLQTETCLEVVLRRVEGSRKKAYWNYRKDEWNNTKC